MRYNLIIFFAFSIFLSLQPKSAIAQDSFSPPPPPPPGTFVSEEEEGDDMLEEDVAPETAEDAAQNRRPERPRFGAPPSRPSARNAGVQSGNVNPAFNTLKKRKPKEATQEQKALAEKGGTDIPFSEAQPEDITNENYPDLIESFDYPNADIADVVKAISELTGKNFIIDPNIRGKITILAPSQITKAEAYKAFLSALAMNGFTVVPYGNFLKIKSVNEAKRDSINTYSGSYSPDTDQLITRIIHLKHISAEEVNRSLRILVSPKGEMAPYPPTNSLIVTDFGANIQRIMSILGQLDVAGFEEQLAVIPIKHAKAKDIAELIEQIIDQEAAGSANNRNSRRSRFSSRISRFNGAGSSSGAAFSQVIPDERTNAIIVVGNNQGIDKIRGLVRRLDYPLNPEDAGGVYVYYMKHAEAKAIADVLNGVAQDVKAQQEEDDGAPNNRRARNIELPDGTNETFFGGDVKITADESINSLIITANRQDYESVKNLLTKLDIPRNQVNVEVIIMEIAATGSRNWGMSTYKFEDTGNPDSNGIARTGFNAGNLNQMIQKDFSSDGFVLGFGGGDEIEIDIAGTDITIPNLISFISFIQSVTDANIMSQPNITVLDNTEATIEVGEKIPVAAEQTQTNQGATTISVQREPATLKLQIKPRISPGSNAVKLEIKQTISQLSNTTVKAQNLAENAVATSERNIETQIVVNNKDTAVIGGLMREEETFSERKVPFLGDIPVLGWLFKAKQTEKRKSNLVMFITPNIIRSVEDVRGLRTEKLDDRIDFIKRNMGGRDPFGRHVDDIAKTKAEKPIESYNEEDTSTLEEIQDEFDGDFDDNFDYELE
tara:strand:+ start:611 stop:3109 length:2499 start_codon:yes stop_codon:yes gene_type:complete